MYKSYIDYPQDDFTADVIIYREDDSAVAVRRRIKEVIARSTDHAQVMQKLLGMGGRIYVDAELEIDKTLAVLKDNTHLIFSPRSKIIVVSDIDHVLDIGSNDINNPVKPKNIVLKNIVIDAQGKANIGISVNMVDGLAAENIYVKDTKWMNIGVMGPARPKTMGDKQYLPDNVLFKHVVIENSTPPLDEYKKEVLLFTGGAYGKVVFEDVYVRADGDNRQAFVYIYENTQGRAETAVLKDFTILNGFLVIDMGVKRVFVEHGTIDASALDVRPLAIHPSGEEVDADNPPDPSKSVLKVIKDVEIYGNPNVDKSVFHIETTSNVVMENVKGYGGSMPAVRLEDSWGQPPASNMENIIIRAVKLQNNGQSIYKCGLLVLNKASTGEIRNVVVDGIIDPAVDNDNIVFFDGGKVIRGVDVRARSLRPSNLYGIGGSTTVYFYKNKRTAIFSGDGSTTQFKTEHGLVSTPSKVIVTPLSADAKDFAYAEADDTYIYFNFSTAPPSGTDNVKLSWYAEV